jgi:UDP-galactopyranose mutase
MLESTPLIIFSHLRWNFVYQRPQHLLSRVAAHRPVFFIEEPICDPNAPTYWRRSTSDNVTVLQPHTPVSSPGFCDEQLPHLRSLLRQLLKNGDPSEGDIGN